MPKVSEELQEEQRPTQYRMAVVKDGVVVNTIVADESFSYPEETGLEVHKTCELCPKGIAAVKKLFEREPTKGDFYRDGKFERKADTAAYLTKVLHLWLEGILIQGVVVEGESIPVTESMLSKLPPLLSLADLDSEGVELEIARDRVKNFTPNNFKSCAASLLKKNREVKAYKRKMLDRIESGEFKYSTDLREVLEKDYPRNRRE